MEKVKVGLLACLLLVLVLQLHPTPPAVGQSAPGEDSGWLMATSTLTGGGSVCYLYDTRNSKLGVYTMNASRLNLAAIRYCAFDFGVIQHPTNQNPSVAYMKKQSEKSGAQKRSK